MVIRVQKVNAHEQRQRVSDELRQLKEMSKGLRTQALRTLIERHAAKRLRTPLEKPPVLPAKAPLPAKAALPAKAVAA
jgi:hypothetical protein